MQLESASGDRGPTAESAVDSTPVAHFVCSFVVPCEQSWPSPVGKHSLKPRIRQWPSPPGQGTQAASEGPIFLSPPAFLEADRTTQQSGSRPRRKIWDTHDLCIPVHSAEVFLLLLIILAWYPARSGPFTSHRPLILLTCIGPSVLRTICRTTPGGLYVSHSLSRRCQWKTTVQKQKAERLQGGRDGGGSEKRRSFPPVLLSQPTPL